MCGGAAGEGGARGLTGCVKSTQRLRKGEAVEKGRFRKGEGFRKRETEKAHSCGSLTVFPPKCLV